MLRSSTKFKNKPNLNGADILYHVDTPYQVCLEWSDVAGYSKEIYGTLLHTFLEKSCKLSLNLEIDRVAEAKKQCPSVAKIVHAAKGNQRIDLLKKSLNVNITSDDLVSVGQLQPETMLMRTQLDDAETTIDEMENEIDLLKAESIDLREKEDNLKDNLKNESTNIQTSS